MQSELVLFKFGPRGMFRNITVIEKGRGDRGMHKTVLQPFSGDQQNT